MIIDLFKLHRISYRQCDTSKGLKKTYENRIFIYIKHLREYFVESVNKVLYI